MRLRRARAIASVLIRERIPMLPQENPLTGISHHRIRLWCDEAPNMMVELFIIDTDLYLVGLQRCIVIGEEEHWSTLFVFTTLLKPMKMV